MSQLGDSQAGEVPSYSAFYASRPFNCLGEAHPTAEFSLIHML